MNPNGVQHPNRSRVCCPAECGAVGLDVTAYIPWLKPKAWMLHPFRVQRVLGDGTYPRVEPVAQMWDPVGVLGDGGMTDLIPGLKPGAEM